MTKQLQRHANTFLLLYRKKKKRKQTIFIKNKETIYRVISQIYLLFVVFEKTITEAQLQNYEELNMNLVSWLFLQLKLANILKTKKKHQLKKKNHQNRTKYLTKNEINQDRSVKLHT